jgi:hypothetical protein
MLLGLATIWLFRSTPESRHGPGNIHAPVDTDWKIASSDAGPGLISAAENSAPSMTESSRLATAKELENPDPPARAVTYEDQAARLQAIVDAISSNNFSTVFTSLIKSQILNPTDEGRELQLRLLQRWSETDPGAAAEALARMKSEDRREARERVAAVWARQNLDQAIAWARWLPEGKDRESALLAIASEISAKTPREALLLASQLTVPENSEFVSRAASAWAVESPDEAMAWAQTIQDPTLRDPIIAAIAVTRADDDPLRAAELILDSIPAGEVQSNAVFGVMQRLAFRDEEAATAWASRFPEEIREPALRELTRISQRLRLIQQDFRAGEAAR